MKSHLMNNELKCNLPNIYSALLSLCTTQFKKADLNWLKIPDCQVFSVVFGVELGLV